eukprot:s647_g5.t1
MTSTQSWGMNCTYGGPSSDFTTFGTGGGPSSGDNRYHVNIFRSSSHAPPAHGAWNGVGRSIFYVSDVDVFYNQITDAGLKAEFAPKLGGGCVFQPMDNPEDRRLVTHCSLKAADLGHAALPFDMHERWAFRLLNEFYEQGDEERSLGVPVSPMCERSGNVQDFRESQKGFLQFVIMPLFKELATVTVPEVGETFLSAARIECNAEEWIKGEPHEDLVQIIKAPPKQVKNTIFVPVSPKQRRRNKQVKDNSPQPGIDSITNQSLASASNLAPAPTEK